MLLTLRVITTVFIVVHVLSIALYTSTRNRNDEGYRGTMTFFSFSELTFALSLALIWR